MRLFKHMLSFLVLFGLSGMGNAEDASQVQGTQTRLSSDGLYEVTIDSRLQPLQLGRMHAWVATIKTVDGAPVTGAEIKVGGGMPIHNHGFPTEPQVTRETGPGEYLIEGVKFSMPGPWVMFLDISANDETDSVAFDIDM